MPDPIVRTVAVFLMAGSAAAFIYTFRNQLTILQSAVGVGLASGAGISGLILLVFPGVITRPFLLAVMAVSPLVTGIALWYSYRSRLRQVHQFRQQAQRARDSGDPDTAQRFQAMADLLVQISGRIKEFTDIPTAPPSGKPE